MAAKIVGDQVVEPVESARALDLVAALEEIVRAAERTHERSRQRP
ncbi:hypothetical protein [Streptomyces spiralis]